MGLDMGYNNSHPQNQAAGIPVHVHADGKKHHHENEPAKQEHKHAGTNHHEKKDDSKTNDCCTNEVLQFHQLDKSMAAKVGIDTPVFVAIFTAFLNIDILKTIQSSSQKYIASYFHPPPPDIRIAIQSFQV